MNFKSPFLVISFLLLISLFYKEEKKHGKETSYVNDIRWMGNQRS
jgi:hypothetical protein